MTKRVQSGEYKVGEVRPDRNARNPPRPSKCGAYGVIKGGIAEDDGHLEWTHICQGALKRSKWFAYRIGPGDNGKGTRTDLLKAFDNKTEAVEWLERRYGSKFTKTY